jgi:hypothetical protein
MLLREFHAIEALWKNCSVFAEFRRKKVARKLTVFEWWPIYFFSQNLFIKSVLAIGTLYSLLFCFFFKVVYGIVFGVTPDMKIISFGVRRLKNRRVTPNREEILSVYHIQHCFICRPSDSTVSEDAGIEPRTVATSALTVDALTTRVLLQ